MTKCSLTKSYKDFFSSENVWTPCLSMSRKYFLINLNNKKTQNESVLDLTVGVSLLFIYRETHLLNVIVIGQQNCHGEDGEIRILQ